MSDTNGKLIPPRTGENHKMFGAKFLKLHNMRDVDWKVADKIKQYYELTQLFEKENEVQKLRKLNNFKQKREDLQLLTKQVQKCRSAIKCVRFGDVQRTKNILKKHPIYQRAYQFKRSFEVADAMKQKTFWIQKQLDRLKFEKDNLAKEYEERLVDVAHKQELVKYFYIDEHKEEARVRELMMEQKNSETRMRAIRIINKTYKRIIDCLLKDSLFYKPLMDALTLDKREQDAFIETTYKVGKPAIDNVKVLNEEFEELDKVIKRDAKIRIEHILQHNHILDHNRSTVKHIVRRDSDFTFERTRYARDTKSMTELKKDMDEVGQDIKMLKGETLSGTAEQVLFRVENQPKHNEGMGIRMQSREKLRDSINEKEDLAKFVRELLLDDLPQIYNDEKMNEIEKLENAIGVEKNKQQNYEDHMRKRGEILSSLRFAFQHMIDVLRHIGSDANIYKEQEFDNPDLKLELLKFGSTGKKKIITPVVMEDDVPKLLNLVKGKIEIMMNYYKQNRKSPLEVHEAVSTYQRTIIKDLTDGIFIPVKVADSYDDIDLHDRSVPTNKAIHDHSKKIVAENVKKEVD